jgi:hypothetical protein
MESRGYYYSRIMKPNALTTGSTKVTRNFQIIPGKQRRIKNKRIKSNYI